MIDEFVDKTLSGIVDKLSPTFDIINRLNDCGYVHNFVLRQMSLHCLQNQQDYHQLNFDVEEIFWIDGGLTNNGITIFALKHREHGIKGLFIAI